MAGLVDGSVEVSIEVDAAPEVVWDLVADLPSMGRWSPECERCVWIGNASGATPGACFKGYNRHGNKRWSTVSTVRDAERGRILSWESKSAGWRIARWTYRISPTEGGGCTVTERFDDQRGAFIRFMGGVVSGVHDRSDHNRSGMGQTLARLKAAAEEAATASPAPE